MSPPLPVGQVGQVGQVGPGPVNPGPGAASLTLFRVVGQVETHIGAGVAALSPQLAIEQGIRAYARARDALHAATASAEANGAAASCRMRVSLWCNDPAGGLLTAATATFNMHGEASVAAAAVVESLIAGANANEFPQALCIHLIE